MGLRDRLHAWERRTRPDDPAFRAAARRRWAELPETARTPGQVLGRFGVGSEGTHGVFPACDLACTPCYHSREANRVRVDGAHTRARVAEQMAVLARRRGPRAHAQLIGGEVTLLPPEDHAACLRIMREHGREPMSMSHGDVDDAYLDALVLGPDGRRRLDRVSFSGHFDRMMFGRRGIPRPPDEAALHPYRAEFVARFRRLRRRHGVRSFLAHTMTVTPANLAEVADVARTASRMGFGMLSFQPAARVGDERRRRGGVDPDAVWAEIERGAGARLDHRVVENGDVRCNRTAYGLVSGDRWFPLLDGDDPRDLAVRDAVLRDLSGIGFAATPRADLLVKLLRRAAARPVLVLVALGWAARAVRRVGAARLLRHGARLVTFVMHSFMDADEVAPAWELTRRGATAEDPAVRGVQERLAACHYAMAHTDGTLVPACVQHAVLDPAENAELAVLLPLPRVRPGAAR